MSPRESTQKNPAESAPISWRTALSSGGTSCSLGKPRQHNWRMWNLRLAGVMLGTVAGGSSLCFAPLIGRAAIDARGPGETMQLHGPEVVTLERAIELGINALRKENLTGFGVLAKTRRKVGHRTDCTVVDASLEADRSHRRETLGDADGKPEFHPPFFPRCGELEGSLAHRQRNRHRATRGFFDRDGIADKKHHSVSRETF